MKSIFEYIVSGVLIISVLYIYIKFIISRPSDKYHNDSWKNRDK